MNSYPVDTLVQVNVTFLSVTGQTPEDPSTVTLTVTAPDQSVTVYTSPQVVRVSQGIYYVQFQVLENGIYIYRWQGTGSVIAASPNGFLQGI